MLDGIVVQNDPVNWVDPEGLSAIPIPVPVPYLPAPPPAVILVGTGALAYGVTSWAIEGTWLDGGIGEWLYDQLYPEDIPNFCEYSPHETNKRKSNKDKHEKGDKRRDQKYKDKKRLKPSWKPKI